jgi:hypothetical protein
MRAVILAFVVGVALAAGSAQAAPFSSKPSVIEFSVAPSGDTENPGTVDDVRALRRPLEAIVDEPIFQETGLWLCMRNQDWRLDVS